MPGDFRDPLADSRATNEPRDLHLFCPRYLGVKEWGSCWKPSPQTHALPSDPGLTRSSGPGHVAPMMPAERMDLSLLGSRQLSAKLVRRGRGLGRMKNWTGMFPLCFLPQALRHPLWAGWRTGQACTYVPRAGAPPYTGKGRGGGPTLCSKASEVIRSWTAAHGPGEWPLARATHTAAWPTASPPGTNVSTGKLAHGVFCGAPGSSSASSI